MRNLISHLVLMFVFVALSAQAQVVNNDTIFHQEERVIAVDSNSLDSLKAFYESKGHQVEVRKVLRDEEETHSLDSIAREARFLHNIISKGAVRNTYMYRQDSIAIPVYSLDRYGFYVGISTGGEYIDKSITPLLGSTFGYDSKWLLGEIRVGFGKTKYTKTSLYYGEEYWSFRAEALLGVTPWHWHPNDTHKLTFIGGIGYEFMSSESAPDENGNYLKSEGNLAYGIAGLRYTWQHFSTANKLSLELRGTYKNNVLLNSSHKKNFGVEVLVSFDFAMFRHPVKFMDKKDFLY